MRHPRPRRATALLAGLLLAAALLTGCTDSEGTNDGGYITGDGQVVLYAAEERGEPVELSGDSLQGDALDVADLRGQVVVVNVWWSQCGPCRVEMPMLVEAAAELAEDPGDVAFLGINIRDTSPENGMAFERSMGVDYPTIYDPSGQAVLSFHGTINPRNVPTTVVLDREGRVAATIGGAVPSKTTLLEVVEDVAASGDGRKAGEGPADG